MTPPITADDIFVKGIEARSVIIKIHRCQSNQVLGGVMTPPYE